MGIKNSVVIVLIIFQFGFSQIENDKCGTFSHLRDGFPRKKISFKTTIDARPVSQKSRLTPGGHFRIHYDTVGINVPSMIGSDGNQIANSSEIFVDTLASILDSVWHSEVELFQFGAPPKDDMRGGGPEYDFYVINKPFGVFGETFWESDDVFTEDRLYGPYSTYITIDNDFYGYRTTGVRAMMATTAHEFHHAIQLGETGIWPNDTYYFEVCAEALEAVVFPEARDYLYDVKTYYNSISSIPLFSRYDQNNNNPGYERAIWGIFLMEKFGTGIMKDIWSELKFNRPVIATQNALMKQSTSIQREFIDFSYWNFATGDRADTVHYFHDGNRFPAVNFDPPIQLTGRREVNSGMNKSFTSTFYKVASMPDTIPPISIGSNFDTLYQVRVDTAFFIVSNCNFQDARDNNSSASLPFQLSVESKPVSGFDQISPYIFAHFEAGDPSLWKLTSIVQTTIDSVVHPYQPLPTTTSCFPNPFNKEQQTGGLLISAESTGGESELFIYSSSMNLVYNGMAKNILYSNKNFFAWDGKDNRSRYVSSGIYLYFIKSQGKIFRGKFTVIR
jgi:hypothetical protein